eukprot:gene1017-1350_t
MDLVSDASDLVVNSRMFDMDEEGEMLLPVVDMANHYNDCPHSVSTPEGNPCQPGSEDLCVMWYAEIDVPAGEE